jgi:hypothetical protein
MPQADKTSAGAEDSRLRTRLAFPGAPHVVRDARQNKVEKTQDFRCATQNEL